MEHEFPEPRKLVLLAVFIEGGLAVLAVFLGWLRDVSPAELIFFTRESLVWGFLAMLPLLLIVSIMVRFPTGFFAPLMQVVDKMLVPMFRDCRVVELAIISILAGVGEEMLFRGVVQEFVADWNGGPTGPWIGLMIASLLFGLLHAITPQYAVLATLIGIYLGLLWIVTDNLMVPILVHSGYDFLVLVYLVKYRARVESPFA